MPRGKRQRAVSRERYRDATVTGRYVPVMSRGDCPGCSHWAILTGGLCSECRKPGLNGEGQG